MDHSKVELFLHVHERFMPNGPVELSLSPVHLI
jgi:hypothetical protein